MDHIRRASEALGLNVITSSALWVTIVQTAAVFVIAAVWQQRWGTIVDTSCMITMAERLLAGEQLYVDLMDNNPPFSTWLFLPAILFSRSIGLAPEVGVYLYTCVAVIVGLSLSAIIVHRAGFAENPVLLRLLPLFAALFMIFPGNALTEREHLGTALFLPLLALMAYRADSKRPPAPGIVLIILAGLSGSVLLLVKPYYAIVYIAPALYVAWRRRSLWSLLLPENCVVAIVGAVYLALVMWLYPLFISEIIPEVIDVYVGTGRPAFVALMYIPPYAIVVFLIWKLATEARQTTLSGVALLASVAGLVPLVYQGKGWPYHAFPAISLAFAAVLCQIAVSPPWRYNRQTIVRATFCVIAVGFAWQPFLQTEKPNPAFVAAIKSASTGQPTLAVIGSDVVAAHPLTRMIGGRFLSPYSSDWFGAFSYQLGQVAAAKGDVAGATHYERLSAAYLDKKYAEFARRNYDLIVVEQDEPWWTDRVLKQPRFAAMLSAYHPIASDARFVVYGRSVIPIVAPKKT